MIPMRRRWVPVMILALGTVWATVAGAQNPERGERGPRLGLERGSFLDLLGREKLQQELNLSEDEIASIREMREAIRNEFREKMAELRNLQNPGERRAKRAEMNNVLDEKVHERIRELLSREKMMRLYQIRLQVRPVVVSLSHEFMARRLELSDEQKNGLAEIIKEMEAKQAELGGRTRGLSQEQRREIMQKNRQVRAEADQKAIELLIPEQKENFEKMKGEKFELPTRRNRQQNT